MQEKHSSCTRSASQGLVFEEAEASKQEFCALKGALCAGKQEKQRGGPIVERSLIKGDR